MSVNIVEIENIYNKLEALGTKTLDEYFDTYSINGNDRAKIISSTITTMMTTAVQSQLQSEMNVANIKELELNGAKDREYRDEQIKTVKINYDIANATKQHKIDISLYNKLKAEADKNVAVGTVDHKIAQALATKDNIIANKEYTQERKTQLIASVDFNNKVKALDSLTELYGQHKIGGGLITASMWRVPLDIVSSLTSISTSGVTTSE